MRRHRHLLGTLRRAAERVDPVVAPPPLGHVALPVRTEIDIFDDDLVGRRGETEIIALFFDVHI